MQGLSADAAPVIVDRLPEDVAACVLLPLPDDRPEDGLLGWNLGRDRAAAAVAGLPGTAAGTDRCAEVWRRFTADPPAQVG